MKVVLPLSILLLASACGNPHLTTNKNPIAQLPIVIEGPATGEDFNLLKVLTNSGEDKLTSLIKDISTSPSEAISITNQDEAEMEVEYKFESGEHFKFNGDNFPGTNGNCSANLQGSSTCSVDVIFESDEEGIFQDILVVTFKPKGSNLPTKVVEFPLKGERKNTVTATPMLSAKAESGADSLELGTITTEQELSAKVKLINIGNVDLKIDPSFESNKFQYNGSKYPGKDGTCGKTLAVDQSCLIDVTFSDNGEGFYSDNLQTNYSPVNQNGTSQMASIAIYGRKILPEVATPGELVASEILGNKVNFGTINAGGQSTKQVEITNIGKTAVKISKVNFSGDSEFTFNGGKFPGKNGTCTEIVQPGSCLLDLVYSPNSQGVNKGELTIVSGEKDKELTLHLRGKAKEQAACYEEKEVLLTAVSKSKAVTPVLPYLTKSESTSATLQVLYGTEVNGYYKPLNMYTVKDAMVYVQYDLPEIKGEVTDINFAVEVQKIVLDNYKDTESLCLSTSSEIRKCSGKQFELDSWQKLINKKFWDKYTKPVTSRYEDEYQLNSTSCGNTSCMRLKTSYNLQEIFALNHEELQAAVAGKKLSLVFSDDTRILKLPKLSIKTKTKVECK